MTSGKPAGAAEQVESLTERELDVVSLLAEGLSHKDIANRFVVAPSTIKKHLKNLYGKLDVQINDDALAHLVDVANGDARGVLNALELAV